MSETVRPYRTEDRTAVRSICCETGFMGDPVDPLFADRDAFADFFTRYYTDYEPENCLVATDGDQVVGYLLGCCRPRRHRWRQPWLLATRVIPKVIGRFLAGRYERQSRRFLFWVVFRASRETPDAPADAGHFHINLLPAHRRGRLGRKLVFGFLDSLPARGITRIYGQIQTRDDRRTERLFERYGFRLLDRREITKFKRFDPAPVYVSTVFLDLGDEPPRYSDRILPRSGPAQPGGGGAVS